uniref:Putative secreted peptide n=1 Tax=Anopheles braziliensis TaxID=58242 RepID=A0A2M3ZNG8_9DIPT
MATVHWAADATVRRNVAVLVVAARGCAVATTGTTETAPAFTAHFGDLRRQVCHLGTYAFKQRAFLNLLRNGARNFYYLLRGNASVLEGIFLGHVRHFREHVPTRGQ